MAKILFKKKRPAIELQREENLMAALLEEGLPVASSCNGDGVCSKCKVQIIEGAENLSPETSQEKELRERNGIDDDHRISCQARVFGNIVIDTPYW